MRHRKHNHQLGVKTAHRTSMLANLSCSLIENGRIKTTLAKARALRPSIEKAITLAKKAHSAEDTAQKVHFRRLAIARLRNKKAVSKLFDELVEKFVNRNGGYTRIYKLALPRLGDASEMALIEFVDEPTSKKNKKKPKKPSNKTAPSKSKAEKESVEAEAEKAESSDASLSDSSESVVAEPQKVDSTEVTEESNEEVESKVEDVEVETLTEEETSSEDSSTDQEKDSK